jgi:prophage regulatory protein
MQNRILRRHEVESQIGLSRSSIYQMMSDGEFPLPIKLGKRAVGWREQEINKWLSDRASSVRPRGKT